MSVRKVVVLGAGTMGAQVAAHAAAQGLEVVLLDLSSPAPDRNVIVRRGIEALKKLKPSPLHLPEHAAALRIGNFDDDLQQIRDADWVFEAVLEDLETKRQLFSKVAPLVKPTAFVTTNTSGLGIAAMTSHLPLELRRRFLGTHFFNPPRYLRLLETIPGPDTDPAVLAAVEAFGDRGLGKGIVRCKDTPNFIANRIGSYGMGAALRAMQDLDLTIEDVDYLTGPAIGRAKSATFRTADIAGVDVCARVSTHLYEALPNDPERELLKVPAFMLAMVEKKWLGQKAGAGFYKKEGKEIRTLDWKALEYRDHRKPSFPSVEAARSVADVGARVNQILSGKDKAAEFLFRVLVGTSLYAASLVPEISDDVWSVDRAMEWGYGWGHGPFRMMDALGVALVAERAQAAGRTVPPLVAKLLGSGRQELLRARRDDDHGLRPLGGGSPSRPARSARPGAHQGSAVGSGRRTPGRASSIWAMAARSSSSTPR